MRTYSYSVDSKRITHKLYFLLLLHYIETKLTVKVYVLLKKKFFKSNKYFPFKNPTLWYPSASSFLQKSVAERSSVDETFASQSDFTYL